MANLHVIFGTGPLGKATMRALLEQNVRIRMINRSGKARDLPGEVEVCQADAYSLDEVRRVTEGAKVIYACAQPPYHQWVEKFPALQESIILGAAQAGARLVIGDNLYMYGDVSGKIHEGLPYGATTRKGRLRAYLAEQALSAHRSGKVQIAIGRGSDFFGPEVLDSTMGERALLPAIQGKKASLVGNIDLPHTYTYIDDFGKALSILGQSEGATGQAWHVPNPPTITQREFMKLVFSEVDRPPQMSGMGKLMMAFGGLFIPEARESVEMMYEFEKPFIVDSTWFEQTFGLKATPLREAIQATVAWYRSYINTQQR